MVHFFHEMVVLYGIALLGYVTRKSGYLHENANEVLTQLVLNITLPALILFSLDVRFSFDLAHEFLWLIAMSGYIMTISAIFAIWLRNRSNLPGSRKPVYEGLIIFGNQGFIGFAVVYLLFGEQGIIYVTIFNLFYLLMIWSYGIFIFTRREHTINWTKLICNPGILSTVIGIILFFLPFGWPSVISTGLEMIGKMTVPLSMMIIGILIANIQTKSLWSMIKESSLWKMTFARLIFIPLLLLPFALFSIPSLLLIIAVIVSGMPSASTVSLYAERYGADSYYGAVGVLLTNVLCVITIPILYFFVMFIVDFL